MRRCVPLMGSILSRILVVCPLLASLLLLLGMAARPAEPSSGLWPSIMSTIGAVALLATLAYHFSRINLRLTSEMAQRQQVQQALSQANEHLSGQLAEIMSLRDSCGSRSFAIRSPASST